MNTKTPAALLIHHPGTLAADGMLRVDATIGDVTQASGFITTPGGYTSTYKLTSVAMPALMRHDFYMTADTVTAQWGHTHGARAPCWPPAHALALII